MSNPAIAMTGNDSADPAVSRFLDAVWMERGLSPNTLAAYRADLTALARWLAERNVPIMRTSRADLQDFIAWRVHAGARPRSTARQLSSFRRFFRYFMREAVIREDPTAQIAMPKIGRSLPRSLTEEEVESLLSAPVRHRPARQPRPHHARGAVRHRPAGLRAGQPAPGPGQPQPGGDPHPRQGRSRAAHPARRGGHARTQGVLAQRARRDPARAADRLPVSRPGAATA